MSLNVESQQSNLEMQDKIGVTVNNSDNYLFTDPSSATSSLFESPPTATKRRHCLKKVHSEFGYFQPQLKNDLVFTAVRRLRSLSNSSSYAADQGQCNLSQEQKQQQCTEKLLAESAWEKR